MSARSTLSTWGLSYALAALAIGGLRYAGLIGTVSRLAIIVFALAPLLAVAVFVLGCMAINSALTAWQWMEGRRRCDEHRRERAAQTPETREAARIISEKYREICARRAQEGKEKADHAGIQH